MKRNHVWLRRLCLALAPRFSIAVWVLLASRSIAATLYVSDHGSGDIFTYNTATGSRSTLATGLSDPQGLAVNSSGDLFVADYITNSIYEFTPAGGESIFATGLNSPVGLAFDATGNLFADSYASGVIYKFTPSGSESVFGTGRKRTPAPLLVAGHTMLSGGPSREATAGSGELLAVGFVVSAHHGHS